MTSLSLARPSLSLLTSSSSLTRRGLAFVAAWALALLGGCHVENHGKDVDFDLSGKFEVCGAFCSQLYDCGHIGPSQYASCFDTCSKQFDKSEAKTRKGCGCVATTSCKVASAYSCDGAPFPSDIASGSASADAGSTDSAGPSSAADGGSSAGTGSSADSSSSPDAGNSPDSATGTAAGPDASSTAGTTVTTCKINQDCQPNQDCISGYCLERCKASCECATGQSCLNGYCSIAMAANKPCSVDCECPSGSKCVTGFCK